MDGEDRVVGGRYRLLGRLGAGAMGAVWRAEDLVLGRDVAVKEVVFPPGIRPEEMEVLRERTRREARSAARLDHPSAVTVYDVVEEHGRPWLVMELVEARTLADVVRSDGPLPPEQVAQIGLAVLGALEAAHRQGIVHRDVKPGNVMLTDSGRTVLTDFGIATSSEDSSLTGTGLLLGSPAYIAPERARGNAPGPASDLWSLGATLFTAVEGRPPYDGADALETVTAVVTGEHAPFVAAGPLVALLDALLVKDPAERLDAHGARRLLLPIAGSGPVATALARPAPARTDAGTAALDLAEVAEDVAEVEAHDGPSSDGPPTGPMRLPRPSRPTPPATRPAPERPAPSRPPRVVRQTAPAVARRRRGPVVPLVTAAVLLVLAAGGLVYSFASGDDDPGQTAAPTTSSSVEPSATATPSVPSGFTRYDATAGWSVSTPSQYVQTTRSGGEVQLRDQETRATLRVRVDSSPPDSVSAFADQRAAGLRTLSDYAGLDRREATVSGAPAIDLELTFFDGVALHVLERDVILNGVGYSLYWMTPEAGWSANLPLFEQIAATFTPAPAA